MFIFYFIFLFNYICYFTKVIENIKIIIIYELHSINIIIQSFKIYFFKKRKKLLPHIILNIQSYIN